MKGKWELGKKRIDVPLRTDIRVGGERTVSADPGKEAASVFKAGAVLRQAGDAGGGASC